MWFLRTLKNIMDGQKNTHEEVLQEAGQNHEKLDVNTADFCGDSYEQKKLENLIQQQATFMGKEQVKDKHIHTWMY